VLKNISQKHQSHAKYIIIQRKKLIFYFFISCKIKGGGGVGIFYVNIVIVDYNDDDHESNYCEDKIVYALFISFTLY